MDNILVTLPMEGKRFFELGKLAQNGVALVCRKQNPDGSYILGVGALSEGRHLNFIEDRTHDPEKIWRGMYAVSKLLEISNTTIALAMIIADDAIELEDFHQKSARRCLTSCYRSADALRKEVWEQIIPPEDLAIITAGLKEKKPLRQNQVYEDTDWDGRSKLVFLKHLSDLRSKNQRLSA